MKKIIFEGLAPDHPCQQLVDRLVAAIESQHPSVEDTLNTLINLYRALVELEPAQWDTAAHALSHIAQELRSKIAHEAHHVH